ncbi:S-layer homology domain-containing protein [Peptoniphilus vaginalis]|uniref:S-layer homology domain-containing protein n=1 Tax=Peptoniphilus vaginalis TaxID=1756987 RepID=UPI0023F69044|nr:S-layer homology domain-containing protein [Peptoniphilus vaginalis]
MKPYSKKYLTLALAGVLAASIPVSAFAEKPAPNQVAAKPATATPGAATQGSATSGTGNPNNKGETQAQPGAEKPKDKQDPGNVDPNKEKKETPEEKKAREDKEAKEKKDKEEREKREEERRQRERLSLSNLKYDGRYLTGYTSSKADIYIKLANSRYGYGFYYSYERIGQAYSNGDIKISVNLKEGETYLVKAVDGRYESAEKEIKNDNYRNIKGTRVDATDLSASGSVLTGRVKGHAFDFITVYLDGEKLGTVRADKDGKFTLTLNKSIDTRDLDNLRFYTDAKTVENKKFKVTEALDGQKVVKGTANTDDEITVYDANGNKISTTYVNNAGVFTAYLNRALINGETIKIEARDKDKNITKIEYKVTKNAVEEVKAIAYIKGYPDGTFKPQANVTRAEAAQMFATLLNGGANFGTSQATKFSDASNDWYSKAINYVVGMGLISGYPNGTFKPNESITRAEFAQMISGYVKKRAEFEKDISGNFKNEKSSTADFKDVKDHWAKDAIDKLYGNKNVTGYPDGSFKPNAKITRAEAVTILNSVFNRNTNKSSLNNVNTSSLNKFSDVSEGFWAYYNILDAANSHNRERLNSTSEVDMWK